jgi:hypothetical protein
MPDRSLQTAIKRARIAAPPQTVIQRFSWSFHECGIEKPSAHGGSWHSAETFDRSLIWQRDYVRWLDEESLRNKLRITVVRLMRTSSL